MEMSLDNDSKRKESPYMETSRDNCQKRRVNKKRIAAPNLFFNFHSQKYITSSSYQLSISSNHGLKHYCFLAQANLWSLWTLTNVKTVLDNFLGPKKIPTTWM